MKTKTESRIYPKIFLSMAVAIALVALTACDSNQEAGAGSKEISGAPDQSVAPQPFPAPMPRPAPTSPAPVPVTPPSVPPVDASTLYTGPAEVAKYVQKFADDAKTQGRDISTDLQGPKLTIQISSLASYGAGVIGLCESGTNLRRVTFDPTFWNSVDDTQRELVVHHELGHCVLYRAHLSSKLSTGEVASIMYPIIMSDAIYESNYVYYQQELFANVAASAMARSQDPNAIIRHICNTDDIIAH